MGDRRVHARGVVALGHPAAPVIGSAPVEIVRYDRGGKWWIERGETWRRRLTFSSAVDIAQTIARNDGEIFFDLPGGNAFDRRLADYRPN